jgi:hypothetical protein
LINKKNYNFSLKNSNKEEGRLLIMRFEIIPPIQKIKMNENEENKEIKNEMNNDIKNENNKNENYNVQEIDEEDKIDIGI